MILAVTVTEPTVTRRRGACCPLPEIDPEWVESTSGLLGALADPNRLRMLAALWRADGPVCICDFTGSLELSQPTISHHMAKLRQAGLVEPEKQGIWIYYRLRQDLPAGTLRLLTQIMG